MTSEQMAAIITAILALRGAGLTAIADDLERAFDSDLNHYQM